MELHGASSPSFTARPRPAAGSLVRPRPPCAPCRPRVFSSACLPLRLAPSARPGPMAPPPLASTPTRQPSPPPGRLPSAASLRWPPGPARARRPLLPLLLARALAPVRRPRSPSPPRAVRFSSAAPAPLISKARFNKIRMIWSTATSSPTAASARRRRRRSERWSRSSCKPCSPSTTTRRPSCPTRSLTTSRRSSCGSDEQKLLEASMTYASGNPILSDAEFDELKLRLKKDGSDIVTEGPRCSLPSQKVYSDLSVDYLKMFLLNVPATTVALGLLKGSIDDFRH